MGENENGHLDRQQVQENMKNILVMKTEINTLKNNIKEYEKDMSDVKKEIKNGLESINNKLLGGMGLIIILLVTTLLGIVFNK
jgi:hypothetical protein